MKKYILTLDQGTTSSRAIVFDAAGRAVSSGRAEFRQYYPQPGWVEHDPEEIWDSQCKAMQAALAGLDTEEIAAVAVTNQRETAILWDRATGRAVHPAIVWQCRRTAPICDDLKAAGLSDHVRRTTGLVIDAYFSGTKIKWILDRDPSLRARAERGELCFGTVDSWLLCRLTGGRVHATDHTNASRTMLFDINRLTWDRRMLDELDIPEAILPEVRDTAGYFGTADIGGTSIPVMAMAGDQQAALFGQTCFEPGDIKNTYGTGCFILCNTGGRKIEPDGGLLATIACKIGPETSYALEGSVFNAGSAIQWLRDGMQMIRSAPEADELAASVPDSGGVYFVPAFTGLGAPYWDMYARGTAVGITRGTGRAHFVRAVLESIAYQSGEVIDAMRRNSGVGIRSIFADGGASASDVLMQFQADILGIPVLRPANIESTALGAAFLAGLAAGFWKDAGELKKIHDIDRTYRPRIGEDERTGLTAGWLRAVGRSRGWAEPSAADS